MVSSSTISPAKGRPTIFGNVCEKNIVFLIDTSGSMYHSLDIVKEHLLETLISRSTSGRDTMFNVISFDENVSKWADHLVQCTPRTVSSASQWIHGLKCGTSTNTMEALLQAYEDDGLDAIYLVTDGLPDQRTSVILENIHRVHKGRPVHATYITGMHSDPAAMEFLESLARETKGSLHIISLTLTGTIKKVTPVYNEKTQYIRNYEGSFLDHIHERPSSAPPSTGLVSSSYYPLNSVRILHPPHGPVPIPYVQNTHYRFDKPRGYSKILDYADSVLASRGLSQFVSRAVSSVPVAASIIKGTTFLARREADGLFYLATVKEQATNENFILDFHKCPALKQSFVQETPIFDCIAIKDARRQPVCIGDKVLAPWQPDGRYGPGTVLDGVDRREAQPSPPGFEQVDGGNLLVAFFNGETKEVAPGVSVRIPLKVFNRLVTELQLPESQRRQIRLASKTTTPDYNGISPPPETTWERRFSPPKASKNPVLEDSDALLKAKIEYQLQRNSHLLGDMRLERKTERANESGVSDWMDMSGKSVQFANSGEVEIEDKYYRSYADRKTTPFKGEVEKADVGIGTEERDFNKYVGRTVQVGVPVAKAGGKPEKKKRWRSWSSGVAPRPPRFRDTMLSKPAEAKDDKVLPRPSHQEYQTVDGVAFPSGTDKKFTSVSWHPYRGHSLGEQKPSREQTEPRLKHHEYKSSTGVPFPPAADRKFVAGANPNWSPDNVGNITVKRSTCWEDGLGEADRGAVSKGKQKIERKRHVAEQYDERIRKVVIEKETKESERLENQRNKTLERNNQIADDVGRKDMERSAKFEFQKQSSQKARENEANKESQAEAREGERRAAMKNRTHQHQKMEHSFEKAAQEYNQQREDGLKEREQKRYQAHHNRLVSERQSADLREQRLKVQAKARDSKFEKIKSDSERYKQMRLTIKKQEHDKYVASVL